MALQVVTDKNSYESASGQSSESRKLQAGDLSYAESSKKAATKAKLEVDGITAEKAAAVSQVSVTTAVAASGTVCSEASLLPHSCQGFPRRSRHFQRYLHNPDGRLTLPLYPELKEPK